MAYLEARDRRDRVAEWVDRNAGKVFILPAVLTLLAFSLFPLLVSAYLTLTKLKFAAGGFTLRYVEWLNFKKLIFGSQQYHLLGTFDVFGIVDWLILGLIYALLLFFFVRYLIRPGTTVVGVIGRSVAFVVAGALSLLLVATLGGGFPGSLVVTLFYVFAGVSVQFVLALGLAVLCAQNIYGRNLFRVVFFLPIMVTPVGIAYMFRMLADTHKGPFADIWTWLGLADFAWAADPWTARIVVLIGDTWQWTPFMFIVLLAAIENQPRDQLEAARIAVGAGCAMIVADGRAEHPVRRLEAGERHTRFAPAASHGTARKRWIAAALGSDARIAVDAGAANALRSGKSLLPAGINRIVGEFGRGEPVSIALEDGETLGQGLVRYTSGEARRIQGRRSGEIPGILGYPARSAMIHRDDMAL